MRKALIRLGHGVAAAVLALTLVACEAKETGPDTEATPEIPDVASPAPTATVDPELARRDLSFGGTDGDHDGRISSAEYAGSATRLFASMDGDDDGTLTVQEMDAARKAMRIGDGAISSEKMIADADNDGDGKLTLAEFIAQVNRRFAMTDGNRDGYLTPAEFSEGHPEVPDAAAPEASATGPETAPAKG